jgi:hypothetical protein
MRDILRELYCARSLLRRKGMPRKGAQTRRCVSEKPGAGASGPTRALADDGPGKPLMVCHPVAVRLIPQQNHCLKVATVQTNSFTLSPRPGARTGDHLGTAVRLLARVRCLDQRPVANSSHRAGSVRLNALAVELLASMLLPGEIAGPH